jgi:predicted nucleic acid-binding Zn ribbon protein
MPSSKGWKTRADERTMRDTPIGSIVDELLVRERALARGLPVGRLAAEWVEVVGPRLGSESAPVSLDGGVLVVAASSGPWGAQVRFMTDEIRRRANERLGGEMVAKVQVTVRPDPQRPV